jgi:hypothetical protein
MDLNIRGIVRHDATLDMVLSNHMNPLLVFIKSINNFNNKKMLHIILSLSKKHYFETEK